ncbi:MAG TPA: RibD family protein, partial [Burkholderiaceae bacterium]|nr:RibD family protein [Burkholderiaceae bacterium]
RDGRYPATAAEFELRGPESAVAAAHGAQPLVGWRPQHGWQLLGDWPADAIELFALYRPLLEVPADTGYVVAHLGQSIDGRIATRSGDSRYVTGPQNLIHLHRMRALSDAIVVGARTVESDDPQLTTRLVPGRSPVRVIIDPSSRLRADRRVFRDGQAPTLLVRAAGADAAGVVATVLPVPCRDGVLDLPALIAALHLRGLRVVFVEGGGVTVSAFVEQDCLDRLQIAIAPVIIGAGRDGLRLPAPATMRDCARPRHRVFRMGDDVLWDFELRSSIQAAEDVAVTDPQPAFTALQRRPPAG